VLAADGAQSRVMAIYARQARAAFDPLQEHYDYLRARAILDGAKGLLSGYPPLVQYAASLERQRRLVLDRLGEAFERALASHTLLEDDGPSSLLAVRRVIAQIDPGDPRLNDGRVPLAFRDAAAAAWAKADLNLADRLVAEGLTFAPSDPGLSDVADRVKRRRAPQSGS